MIAAMYVSSANWKAGTCAGMGASPLRTVKAAYLHIKCTPMTWLAIDMRRNWDWKLACDVTALYAILYSCGIPLIYVLLWAGRC